MYQTNMYEGLLAETVMMTMMVVEEVEVTGVLRIHGRAAVQHRLTQWSILTMAVDFLLKIQTLVVEAKQFIAQLLY